MKRPEGSFYEPLVWSLGGLLVVSGITLSILMWANVIGPFRFLGLSPEHASQAVGLWIPRSDAHAVDAETSRRLSAWRRMLEDERTVIAHRTLRALIDAGVGTIAVPDARALDADDLEALVAFAQEGGGVVLTGWVAVRTADGRWRGPDAMRGLLALEPDALAPAPGAVGLAPAAPGPLSAALAPDEPIRLAQEAEPPGVRDPRADLRWLDAESRPGLGASRRLLIGRGRLVWLAAGPERAWEADLEPWQPLVRVVRASVAWVSRSPLLQWLERPGGEALVADVRRVGPRRLLIDVSNLGPDELNGAVLRVHLNQRVRSTSIQASALLQQAPEQRLRPGAEFVDLVLPPLNAGDSRSFHLDYQEL